MSNTLKNSAGLATERDSGDLENSLLKNGKPSNVLLLWVAALTFFFFALAEIAAALLSNSLSLLGDAVTMIVDACTYFFNMYAERNKGKTDDRLRKAKLEFFSPLISVTVLILISGYIIYDATATIVSKDEEEDVNDTVMFWFSVVGLAIDFLNIGCFSRAQRLFGYSIHLKTAVVDDDTEILEEVPKDKSNMNMCSAYTHVVADTFRSLAVLGAASVSQLDKRVSAEAADAYAAIVVSAIILCSTVPLIIGLKAKHKEIKMLKALKQ